MELQQIKYFVEVARLLNFTQAAKHFNVTQPALTKAVQKLEHEFGGNLLHRERRLTTLTELGKLVLPACKRLVASEECARSIAQNYRKKANSPLRVGVSPCVSAELLVKPLTLLSHALPGVRVELVEELPAKLLDLLFEGDIGAALTADMSEFPDRVDENRLFDDRLVALLPHGHRLAQHEVIPLSALMDADLLERAGCETASKFFAAAFGEAVKPKIAHRGRHESHLQYMVEAGLGILLAPSRAPHLSSIVSRPVEGNHVPWPVSLLVVGGRRFTPALECFLRIVKAQDWSRSNEGEQRPIHRVNDASVELIGLPTDSGPISPEKHGTQHPAAPMYEIGLPAK